MPFLFSKKERDESFEKFKGFFRSKPISCEDYNRWRVAMVTRTGKIPANIITSTDKQGVQFGKNIVQVLIESGEGNYIGIIFGCENSNSKHAKFTGYLCLANRDLTGKIVPIDDTVYEGGDFLSSNLGTPNPNYKTNVGNYINRIKKLRNIGHSNDFGFCEMTGIYHELNNETHAFFNNIFNDINKTKVIIAFVQDTECQKTTAVFGSDGFDPTKNLICLVDGDEIYDHGTGCCPIP